MTPICRTIVKFTPKLMDARLVLPKEERVFQVDIPQEFLTESPVDTASARFKINLDAGAVERVLGAEEG